MSDILVAAELAGFMAAHAVWCVASGDTLTPIYSYSTQPGQRAMERLVDDRLEDAVAFGKTRLVENPHGAIAATLIFDGYVSLETGKTDALIVEFRTYTPAQATVLMVLPYRAASAPGGFAVHRPKIRQLVSVNEDQIAGIVAAFFDGVGSHDQGSKVWNDHLDESR